MHAKLVRAPFLAPCSGACIRAATVTNRSRTVYTVWGPADFGSTAYFSRISVVAGGVDEIRVESTAVDESEVGFFDGAAVKLPGEAPVGLVGFGDEDEAGGVGRAVDDARTPGSEPVERVEWVLRAW